jgi:hypothetical protein
MSNDEKPIVISTVYFLKEIYVIFYEERKWEMYDVSPEGIRYISRNDCLEEIYHIIPFDQFNELLKSLRYLKNPKPFSTTKADMDGSGVYFKTIDFLEKR